jgi:A/G-specific adenine glycosylase
LPAARPSIEALTASITPAERAGDFAQAMMDLGATICTPRSPVCALCPLQEGCAAHLAGTPDRFPRKQLKAAKPVRRGTMFWLECDGAVMLVRRPARGLLGGMRALPTGPWTEADPGLAEAPVAADWREMGTGRHVFTHFALDYRVMVASCVARTNLGEWWLIDNLGAAGLPTLFARAARIAIPEPV